MFMPALLPTHPQQVKRASFLLSLWLFFICHVHVAIGFAAATPQQGRGFGSGVQNPTSSGKKVKQQYCLLSKEANKLLKKHSNNLDAASSEYFQSQLIQQQQQIERDYGKESMEKMHEARVAATWNTVALFLPLDYQRSKGKLEPSIERRLRHIGRACCIEDTEDGVQLLDVGCGDGSLLPYLSEKCHYSGLDLSSEMIDIAKQRYPDSKTRIFLLGSFPHNVPVGSLFDVIVFNGSLQFFRDLKQTIHHATSFLKPGGRIVLAHVNGAKFVKQECVKNPLVAVRTMPNSINLETMAAISGLNVLNKTLLNLENYNELIDGNNEDFYLVVLEKPTTHLL